MFKYFYAIFILTCFVTSSYADTLTPSQFGYGITLTPKNNDNALYVVSLPPVIYQHIAYKNLSDIRIFDSKGELVPSKMVSANPDIIEKPYFLPFSLISSKNSKNSSPLLQVTIGSEKTLLHTLPNDNTAIRKLTYIVDLNSIKSKNMESLIINWQEQKEQSWMNKVNVYTSSDLDNWQKLPYSIVANLKQGNETIIKNNINVHGEKLDRYIMLQFEDSAKGFSIKSVQGKISYQDDSSQKLTYFTPTTKQRDDNSYEFSIDGYYPISLLKIKLPSTYSVKVNIYSRDDLTSDWSYVNSADFYQFQYDKVSIQQQSVTFPPNQDKYWKITFVGDINETPEVALGYYPAKIQFANQNDNKIYILAFGNYLLSESDPASAELINKIIANSKQSPSNNITLGQLKLFAGDSAVVPPKQKDTSIQRTYILWGILILAALILLLMIYWLLKKCN